MRSHGKGSLSATTQVKVSSPEIFPIALGQEFHFLETNIGVHAKGECIFDVPGSKSEAGRQGNACRVRKWRRTSKGSLTNRRSQKRKMSWERFNSHLEHYPLPKPRIVHSFYVSPC